MKKLLIAFVAAGLMCAAPAFAGNTNQVTGGQPTCQLKASTSTFTPTTDPANPVWNTETFVWSTSGGKTIVWKADGNVVTGIPATASGNYTFSYWYQTPYPSMTWTLEVWGASTNKFTACSVNLLAI